MRIGREVAALRFASGDHLVRKVEPGGAANGEILLIAVRQPRIDVQIRDRSAEIVERVGRIIFGTEQAFFFASYGEKDDRAIGSRTIRENACLFDQL